MTLESPARRGGAAATPGPTAPAPMAATPRGGEGEESRPPGGSGHLGIRAVLGVHWLLVSSAVDSSVNLAAPPSRRCDHPGRRSPPPLLGGWVRKRPPPCRGLGRFRVPNRMLLRKPLLFHFRQALVSLMMPLMVLHTNSRHTQSFTTEVPYAVFHDKATHKLTLRRFVVKDCARHFWCFH